MIKFKCQNCKEELFAEEEKIGKSYPCLKCGINNFVPKESINNIETTARNEKFRIRIDYKRGFTRIRNVLLIISVSALCIMAFVVIIMLGTEAIEEVDAKAVLLYAFIGCVVNCVCIWGVFWLEFFIADGFRVNEIVK